jgi:hypothetical protein
MYMRGIFVAGFLVVSVLASSTAFGAMTGEARSKFVAQCHVGMYLPNAQCDCMADIADKALDDLAIAYLSLPSRDPIHAAAISKSMTSREFSAVDNFMKTAPHTCKGAK